jgi:hypothetical protein
VLKGALLFELWTEQRYRPTRDADFLSKGENSPERYQQIFEEICDLNVEDGLSDVLPNPTPRLLSYPGETVIAEEFQALVQLGIVNTRMKDFHDLKTFPNSSISKVRHSSRQFNEHSSAANQLSQSMNHRQLSPKNSMRTQPKWPGETHSI